MKESLSPDAFKALVIDLVFSSFENNNIPQKYPLDCVKLHYALHKLTQWGLDHATG